MTEMFTRTDRCCGNYYPTSHSKSPSRHVCNCSGLAHDHQFVGEVKTSLGDFPGHRTYLMNDPDALVVELDFSNQKVSIDNHIKRIKSVKNAN